MALVISLSPPVQIRIYLFKGEYNNKEGTHFMRKIVGVSFGETNSQEILARRVKETRLID